MEKGRKEAEKEGRKEGTIAPREHKRTKAGVEYRKSDHRIRNHESGEWAEKERNERNAPHNKR
jgi:hypothetical protein